MIDDDGLGDPRIAAVARIAKDVPAAFPDGPSHKAGTPIYHAALVQTDSGEYVGFNTPSATAMALSLAIKAKENASELHAKLVFWDQWGQTRLIQSSNDFKLS